jgi:ATP-dependent Clp protease ATP-binding subunit ClpA
MRVFERFTDRARRVLVLAQDEGRVLNHDFVGPEHILLGLISESEGIPARVFSDLGISLDAARRAVEVRVGRSSGEPTGSPPFTPRTKRLLENSRTEAVALRHQYIGPEHLFLGLLALAEVDGVEVLVDLSLDTIQLRESVLEKVAPGDDPPRFSTDDRRHGGGRRPRPLLLKGWRRLWYTRIVRLPFVFYPVVWFDCSVPGTRGHLTWLVQPREFRSDHRRLESHPGT